MEPQNQNQSQQTPPVTGAPASDNSASAAPHKNVLMAVLAYLGILIVIPFITAKDDPFVKFHIKQGLILLIGWVISYMISHLVWSLYGILQVFNLIIFVFAIVGIINAVKGREKELPYIGHLGAKFHF